MQTHTPDGGITTTDEQRTHTIWPCIPHPVNVPCEEARTALVLGKTLQPAPKEYKL